MHSRDRFCPCACTGTACTELTNIRDFMSKFTAYFHKRATLFIIIIVTESFCFMYTHVLPQLPQLLVLYGWETSEISADPPPLGNVPQKY